MADFHLNIFCVCLCECFGLFITWPKNLTKGLSYGSWSSLNLQNCLQHALCSRITSAHLQVEFSELASSERNKWNLQFTKATHCSFIFHKISPNWIASLLKKTTGEFYKQSLSDLEKLRTRILFCWVTKKDSASANGYIFLYPSLSVSFMWWCGWALWHPYRFTESTGQMTTKLLSSVLVWLLSKEPGDSC